MSTSFVEKDDFRPQLEGSLRKSQLKKYGKELAPVDIRENIKYKRKNNYELYVDSNKVLQQHKVGVNEPRQILKGNVPELRYAINDLEIIFNVYPFEPRYEKKILRETLKPASLCYTIAGLLLPHLNEIRVDGAPVFGFVIHGTRKSDNTASNVFKIDVVLSNIEYPLGTFEFPVTEELHYQIPFLVNYYENVSGYNRKNFSYICSLPKFLIDVIHTSSSGLQFNFNGKELPAKELFPITVTYFAEHSKSVPVQKAKPSSAEVSTATDFIRRVGTDIKYRFVTNAGPAGTGLQEPLERALANSSFAKMKDALRHFLVNPAVNSLPQEFVTHYFLILSQNLLKKANVKSTQLIKNLELSNVVVDNSKFLVSFELKLTLEDGNVLAVKGTSARNAKIPVPLSASTGNKHSSDVPPSYGFEVTPSGLKHAFCKYESDFSKLFDYKINKLASLVV